MPAAKRFLPTRLPSLLFAATLPADAAGIPFESLGLDSSWEIGIAAAILIAASLFCFREASRRGNLLIALPAFLLLPVAAGLLQLSTYYTSGAERERPPEYNALHRQRAVGGWAVWTDTANAGGDKRVLASFLGRDSGSVFMLETHLERIREYPLSFLCFNLYESPEPQRYSDIAAKAVGLEIHRFNILTAEGMPKTDIHYDFTVKRRDRTWHIQGSLDGIDIGGDYEDEGDETGSFFPPSSWNPPEGYR